LVTIASHRSSEYRGARVHPIAVRLLDLADRSAGAERRERALADHLAELVAQPLAALGQLEAHAVEPREARDVLDRGLLQAAEHDVEHAQLHALDGLVTVVEPPRALRPAQRLNQLVPGLTAELLDQLLDGQEPERDECFAELAADGRRPGHGLVVLLLRQHAARHEEVAERLVARRRGGADRVAVDEVDGLGHAAAP
jgi:hypothetical protein